MAKPSAASTPSVAPKAQAKVLPEVLAYAGYVRLTPTKDPIKKCATCGKAFADRDVPVQNVKSGAVVHRECAAKQAGVRHWDAPQQ